MFKKIKIFWYPHDLIISDPHYLSIVIDEKDPKTYTFATIRSVADFTNKFVITNVWNWKIEIETESCGGLQTPSY